MVAISTILVATVAQLAITASAGTCKTFTYYCGSNLLNRGRLFPVIAKQVLAHLCPTTDISPAGWTKTEIQGKVLADSWNSGVYPTANQVSKSLYKCAGQGNTLVWAHGRTPCGSCVDGGSNRNDYCAERDGEVDVGSEGESHE
jgi:hypothetical protein